MTLSQEQVAGPYMVYARCAVSIKNGVILWHQSASDIFQDLLSRHHFLIAIRMKPFTQILK